ncbi:aminotransferase class IV [Candidatus Woesearchaeota archaeon]|nr:aminotransferase class IV [Candidatus Woesearchaeota archaeon]
MTGRTLESVATAEKDGVLTRQVDKPHLVWRLGTHDEKGKLLRRPYNQMMEVQEYRRRFGASPWEHVRHYATGVFEGVLAIRSERDPTKVNILTLDENVDRLFRSMRSFSLVPPTRKGEDTEIHDAYLKNNPGETLLKPEESVYLHTSKRTVREGIVEIITKSLENGLVSLEPDEKGKPRLIYIRPAAGKGEFLNKQGEIAPQIGVDSILHEVYLEVTAKNVGRYLDSGEANGIDGLPRLPKLLVYEPKGPIKGIMTPGRLTKGIDNYGEAGKAKVKAKQNGFDEALLLDPDGYVLEGGGENVYFIKDEVLITPSLKQSILPGTKRKLVLNIARILGIKVQERKISLDEALEADAMAMSGTWMGFGAVGEVYQHSKRRSAKYQRDNPLINLISLYYEEIIHDREITHHDQAKQNALIELQKKILYPINIPDRKAA